MSTVNYQIMAGAYICGLTCFEMKNNVKVGANQID
jgi:hypothetical protein